MTMLNIEAFDLFLEQSFSADRKHRELRLSEAEAAYIAVKYAHARIQCTSPSIAEYPDGKVWYEIDM
ncbi:hypothetical protein FHS15_005002 [Paenibacillus castaneae]|uniref:hypothetical protein n=1 Tax=Paenibacillus castaneae TaxID=474957 RepID=UPI000C99DB62|nr:hypothetical protein [Paenibacillus castaneae]NIK79835.1 hypothetical protein [Paenibacillus castaneae]